MVDAKRAESEAWLELDLQATASSVRELAQHCRGDSLKLLALLRLLESLHQEIREGLFQESLPDNRQALYSLLKDIETVGGWPYIHRMKLQLLLKNISTEANGDLLSVLVETTPAPNPKDTTAQ